MAVAIGNWFNYNYLDYGDDLTTKEGLENLKLRISESKIPISQTKNMNKFIDSVIDEIETLKAKIRYFESLNSAMKEVTRKEGKK